MQKIKQFLVQLRFCCSPNNEKEEDRKNEPESPQFCMTNQKKQSQQTTQLKNSEQEEKDQNQESPRFKNQQENQENYKFIHPQLGSIEINKEEIEKKIREPKMRRVTVKGQLQKMDSGEALEQIQRKIKKQQTNYTKKKNQKIEKYIEKNLNQIQQGENKDNVSESSPVQIQPDTNQNSVKHKKSAKTNFLKVPSFEEERDQ